jgi:glutathione S-transferase
VADYRLHVFDYNYSSWSMRAGVVMRLSGVAFDEARVHLDDAGRARIRPLSPSGLLPLLEHGERRVWDSLAIAEYMAEQCPDRELWPRDAHARAVARAASAEMHSGFGAIRQGMPMNLRARFPGFARSAEAERQVARVKALWSDLRTRFGRGGEYLCGAFGIVDAMYAPVVARFRSYDVRLDGACAEYAAAVLRHPAVAGWLAAATREELRIPDYEFVVG